MADASEQRRLLPPAVKTVRRGEIEKGEEEKWEKLALITSCIFKQARAACGEESSILGEPHEKDGDVCSEGGTVRGPPGDIDRFLSITVRTVVGALLTPPAVLMLMLASFLVMSTYGYLTAAHRCRSSSENPAVDTVSLLSGESGVVHLCFISLLAKTEGSRFCRRQLVSRCFNPRLKL